MISRNASGASKGPNMRDVANEAGVSLSTVSLVVNNKPGVSPDRRERVLQAIKSLGYMNSQPGGLPGGQQGGQQNGVNETRVLGMLMESLSEASRADGYYTRVVAGIEETAYKLGYQVLLHIFRPEIDPLDSLRELMGRDVDGLIIANDGDVTPEIIHRITLSGTPMVLVENYQNGPIYSVTADNFTAGRMMTEYLIELGHRRIGALRGPAKYSSLCDRLRGYEVALLEHGLPIDPALIPPPVSGHPRKGYVQMQQMLALTEPPTAVFAVSDRAAHNAMDAAKDAGLRIPHDISIVGIDDIQDSAFASPPLTTYRVPKYDLGRAAVQILHGLITQQPMPPLRSVLIGDMQLRRSAAAPKEC